MKLFIAYKMMIEISKSAEAYLRRQTLSKTVILKLMAAI
jgi:hypothetical protein